MIQFKKQNHFRSTATQTYCNSLNIFHKTLVLIKKIFTSIEIELRLLFLNYSDFKKIFEVY